MSHVALSERPNAADVFDPLLAELPRQTNRKVKQQKKAKTEKPPPYTVRFDARSGGQRVFMTALQKSHLLVGLGVAGTGKTLLAVQEAVEQLLAKQVDKLILSRPTVSAEEDLGFLPGDIREKMDPYLRPLYDALLEKLGGKAYNAHTILDGWLKDGTVEIAPLGFLRGRTFKKAYIIVDECQNCTYGQLKMAATRLGEGSRMCFTGDPAQTDLPAGQSGLVEFVQKIEDNYGDKYPVIRFMPHDVQRHEIVADLVKIL